MASSRKWERRDRRRAARAIAGRRGLKRGRYLTPATSVEPLTST